MDIRIESPDYPLKASLNRYLRRRLTEEFAFCAGRIAGVRACFSRGSAVSGCIDEQCQLVVRIDESAEVVVRSAEPDLFVAIRQAVDRLHRALARRTDHEVLAQRVQAAA
jgi:ribosome-associated translation inhibitor RaiA